MKPENILLTSKAPDATIKIADFGLAVEINGENDRVKGRAGTPAYMSPEIILDAGGSTPVDMWSIGVILYTMLVGYPPFWFVFFFL